MADVTPIVAKYGEVRDAIAALKKQHAKALEPYITALDKLEAALVNYLNTEGIQSVRTEAGTLYTKSQIKHTVSDRAEFLNWMVAQNRYDCIDLHANTPACEAEFKESGELPPGIARWEARVARVKRV